MKMGPAGSGRLMVGLAAIGLLAILVRVTMEPGKFQQLTWLLLGFFAVRMLFGWLRSRRMVETQSQSDPEHRTDEQG